MTESKNQVKAKGTRGQVKTRVGIVVSDKMEKTVVVAITRQVRHATYGKYIKRTDKYFAHDEKNACGIGDQVEIVETKPLSKNKSWKVHKILSKAI